MKRSPLYTYRLVDFPSNHGVLTVMKDSLWRKYGKPGAYGPIRGLDEVARVIVKLHKTADFEVATDPSEDKRLRQLVDQEFRRSLVRARGTSR